MRIAIVGQWIEFDGQAVALLKPNAKPGELLEFMDHLNQALDYARDAEEANGVLIELRETINQAANTLGDLGWNKE